MSSLTVEMIPVLDDNYVYVIHEPSSGTTGVVDPAVAAPVRDRLQARGWSLDWILSTHHHADHTGGNLELKQATGCRIAGPGKDASRIPGIDVKLIEGDRLKLGDAEAEIFEDAWSYVRAHFLLVRRFKRSLLRRHPVFTGVRTSLRGDA